MFHNSEPYSLVRIRVIKMHISDIIDSSVSLLNHRASKQLNADDICFI